MITNERLQEYIERAGKDGKFGAKDWDFIKAHLPKHVFDDIMGKGVTRNYNTKPNEKLHGPLKNAYRDQTNFKDVAPQVFIRFFSFVLIQVKMLSLFIDTSRGAS